MLSIPYDFSGKPRPESLWLDKTTHHALVDLERKYGDIPWIPLAIPKILPNNLDHFIRYFNENAKAGVRKTHSYDEPDNDPNNKSSSWNNPYWKTLELYRGPSSEKWFGTNTIENYNVDARNIFPELYEQIFDLLPYKELFFVRFWSNIRPVGLHRDQDWTYNLPLSCRSIISDSNIDPTFYLSKTKGSLEDRQYVKLPADTNTFAFNNGAFWHGADYAGYNKILMVVSGIPDVDKFEKILSNSTVKYRPVRVYDTNTRYTVYNITSRSKPIIPHKIIDFKKLVKDQNDSVHSFTDIKDLYTLLLTSPNEVLNVEEHHSTDGLRSELRVVFWNQDAYYRFSDVKKEKYQEIVERLNKNYVDQNVEFFRYTSTDNYQSEFRETKYPEPTPLINWTLIDYFKKWFIENLIPLGKSYDYLGRNKFIETKIDGARFIKERTSNIERLLPDRKSMNTFPDFIAYHFELAVESSAIKKQPYIYHRFTKLSRDVESFAEKYIINCDNAAVLVGHQSLGENINLHTHRLQQEKKFTFTVAIRLTFDDVPITYQAYDPLSDNDPNLLNYYADGNLLQTYIHNKVPKKFSSESRTSVLVFNGSYTPHSVDYNKDVYLFFVYDNVTFKPGMFETIQRSSQHKLFLEQEPAKRLYFWEL